MYEVFYKKYWTFPMEMTVNTSYMFAPFKLLPCLKHAAVIIYHYYLSLSVAP